MQLPLPIEVDSTVYLLGGLKHFRFFQILEIIPTDSMYILRPIPNWNERMDNVLQAGVGQPFD